MSTLTRSGTDRRRPHYHGMAQKLVLPRLMISSSVVALVAAIGLGLAGCKPAGDVAGAQNAPPPLAALPLTNAQAGPGATAPDVESLPSGRPARVTHAYAPREGYAYLDRAYELNRAFADAPPDYTFDDGQVEPWVWRSDDGYYRVVEPLPSGDRYYYYAPGADYPFLVRDPNYAYGYADGVLAAIFDGRGRALPDEEVRRRADYAGRYLERAQMLMGRAQHERHAVAQSAWSARQTALAADGERWTRAQAEQADWRAYHDANAGQEQAHWAPEAVRRNAEAARFAQQSNDPGRADRAWRAARDAQQVQSGPAKLAQAAPPPGPATTSVPAGLPPASGGHGQQDRIGRTAPDDQAAAQRQAQLQAEHQAQQQHVVQGPADRPAEHDKAPTDQQSKALGDRQAEQAKIAQAQADRQSAHDREVAALQAKVLASRQVEQQQLAKVQADRRVQHDRAVAQVEANVLVQRKAYQQKLNEAAAAHKPPPKGAGKPEPKLSDAPPAQRAN